MMWRKIVLLMAMIMGCHSATYACFKMGPLVTGSVSHLRLKSTSSSCFAPEMGIGYQLGLMVRGDFPLVYIQPELLWTHSEIKFRDLSHLKKYTLQFQKIEAPILLGIRLLGAVSLQVGPTFSYELASKKDGLKASLRCKDNLRVGYQVGLGIDFRRLMLSVKYEGNLSKVCTTFCKVPVDHREGIFILSVGFNILKSNH